MSGEPPHHPHNIQMPPWDFMGIPNHLQRRPQHAHMSNEHSVLHQPLWHTPSTESIKPLTHSHAFPLHRMFDNRPLPQTQSPGVDLSVTSQNGEVSPIPISLSVRDTKKINSLPPSALEIEAVEISKCPVPARVKTVVTDLCDTTISSVSGAPISQTIDNKFNKRLKPLDSVLERLNPNLTRINSLTDKIVEPSVNRDKAVEKSNDTKSTNVNNVCPLDNVPSVIVQANSSQDDSSDSSSILNVPVIQRIDEECISINSNDDSSDSKSRRKRKPSKTVRCSKDAENTFVPDGETPQIDVITGNPIEYCDVGQEKKTNSNKVTIIEKRIPERRRSSDDAEIEMVPAKSRRKTSSESETIDNIAAMVQEGLKEKQLANSLDNTVDVPTKKDNVISSVSVSVIKTKDHLQETVVPSPAIPLKPVVTNSNTPVFNTLITPAQKKETHFVEVENKLEEMFAGIEDVSDPLKTDNLDLDSTKFEDPLPKFNESVASTSQDNVTSTSNEVTSAKKSNKKKTKNKVKTPSRRSSDANTLDSTHKAKASKKLKGADSKTKNQNKNKKQINGSKQGPSKSDFIKESFGYDSGSNASSSKSRGPFIHIRGHRDSPISVNVINTPTNDDDVDKKSYKAKKFHDDSEYRHKVRSKGLHCSTLSNKYDAQTRDISWICVFCKKGPHTSEIPGVAIRDCSFPTGDLFGPYFVTTETPEFARRLDDPYDKQFKSKKIARLLEIPNLKPSSKKSKRKHLESSDGDMADPYVGITETDNKLYEIWAHEDCIVWSPGIYLIGPKIIGLEEAVWTSCNIVCLRCNLKGANICCVKRGCLKVAHIWCAKSLNWQFDEDNFKAFCPQHQKIEA